LQLTAARGRRLRARRHAGARVARLALSSCLALAAAVACRRPPEHVFRCPGGAALRARFAADSVALRLPEGAATLPVARSASGARNANDTRELWEHAGEVRVTRRGGGVYEGCRPAR
jgi:membrane-bound lysozyme inhibitor of c-type lysozyme MliC